MLVELGIGDAFGFSFEFADPRFVAKRNSPKNGYVRHHKWSDTIKPGSYSDDTQMSLALAEFMLVDDEPWTTRRLADAFVSAFKRDIRPGYAGGFFMLLQEVKDGSELLDRLTPHSIKSGGAMRAAPCGLLQDPYDVIDKAEWQASLTHATRDGMEAAAGAALLVWACRHGIARDALEEFLDDYLPATIGLWEGPVGSSGLDAVSAAVTAIQKWGSLSNILWECVRFTGDVDTVAAIAMAAASMHPDIKQDLPQILYDRLENGPFGRDYLRAVDERLMAAFPLDAPPVQEPAPGGDADFLDLLLTPTPGGAR